jgi:hypothetical protein
MNDELVELIAKVTYEANRAYCTSMGDYSFKDPYVLAPDWQKETNRKGVIYRLTNPSCTAEEMHESWMKEKLDDGWKFGPVKNAEAKEHPCLVPYDQLPEVQRAKDRLFAGIVDALKDVNPRLPIAHDKAE